MRCRFLVAAMASSVEEDVEVIKTTVHKAKLGSGNRSSGYLVERYTRLPFYPRDIDFCDVTMT